MLIVLSPAKSLDYETPVRVKKSTLPDFVADSAKLIADLKTLSPQAVAKLMSLSDPLAALNAGRFRDWSSKFTEENSKQAIFAFNGDVYEGFDAASSNSKAIDFAQDHVRILSGLYGLLRPLDLMHVLPSLRPVCLPVAIIAACWSIASPAGPRSFPWSTASPTTASSRPSVISTA